MRKINEKIPANAIYQACLILILKLMALAVVVMAYMTLTDTQKCWWAGCGFLVNKLSKGIPECPQSLQLCINEKLMD